MTFANLNQDSTLKMWYIFAMEYYSAENGSFVSDGYVNQFDCADYFTMNTYIKTSTCIP